MDTSQSSSGTSIADVLNRVRLMTSIARLQQAARDRGEDVADLVTRLELSTHPAGDTATINAALSTFLEILDMTIRSAAVDRTAGYTALWYISQGPYEAAYTLSTGDLSLLSQPTRPWKRETQRIRPGLEAFVETIQEVAKLIVTDGIATRKTTQRDIEEDFKALTGYDVSADSGSSAGRG